MARCGAEPAGCCPSAAPPAAAPPPLPGRRGPQTPLTPRRPPCSRRPAASRCWRWSGCSPARPRRCSSATPCPSWSSSLSLSSTWRRGGRARSAAWTSSARAPPSTRPGTGGCSWWRGRCRRPTCSRCAQPAFGPPLRCAAAAAVPALACRRSRLPLPGACRRAAPRLRAPPPPPWLWACLQVNFAETAIASPIKQRSLDDKAFEDRGGRRATTGSVGAGAGVVGAPVSPRCVAAVLGVRRRAGGCCFGICQQSGSGSSSSSGGSSSSSSSSSSGAHAKRGCQPLGRAGCLEVCGLKEKLAAAAGAGRQRPARSSLPCPAPLNGQGVWRRHARRAPSRLTCARRRAPHRRWAAAGRCRAASPARWASLPSVRSATATCGAAWGRRRRRAVARSRWRAGSRVPGR
jgi:hypothetical protein